MFWLMQTICIYHISSIAQCSVSISGNACIGSTLTANFSGGTLKKLEWKKDGKTVYMTDTITYITVAGGNGNGNAANQLYYPTGFHVDADKNIYIADRGNYRIQKWAAGATSGITIPGSDNQQLPSDVFVDKDGNVYATNIGSNILKYVPGADSAIIVASFYDHYGSGIHVDADGNIYAAELFNNIVQKWLSGSIDGITVANGFDYPWGIYVDAAGNIYVADQFNNRIQKWAPGATSGVTVAGGNGAGEAANQLLWPTGVFVDADGKIFVADNGNCRIQEWAPGATSGVTVAGGNGRGSDPNQFDQPYDVIVDTDGNIYVVDFSNSRVQKIIPGNGTVNTEFTADQAGIYTVTATSQEGCVVTSDSFVINDPPHIDKINGRKRELCGGGVFTYTADKYIRDATYSWSVPANCSIVSGQGTDTITINIPANFLHGEIKVMVNNGCAGNTVTDTLSTKPQAPVEVIGDSLIDPWQTGLIYSTPQAPGIKYYWFTYTDATIVSGQGTNSVTVNWGSESGRIQVKATRCGDSSKQSLHVRLKGPGFANKTAITGEKNNSLLIFPNPVKDILHIEGLSSTSTKTISIIDIKGKKLQQITTANSSYSFNVKQLSSGVYFARIDDGDKTTTLKFIKD